MIEFFLTFLFLLAIVAAMAIGVMRGRKPIAGSCGGLANQGIAGACEICGGDMAKCGERGEYEETGKTRTSGAGNFYDAA